MTGLKNKITEDLKTALKEKRRDEVSTLRLLLATILNKEKEKRYKIARDKLEFSEEKLIEESQLNNDEIMNVIFAEIKKREESILEFEKGKRIDLVEKERKEIEILNKYLPRQLSEKEIENEARKIIEKIGAKGSKDAGRVMKELMPRLRGTTRGDVVGRVVSGLLTGNK